MLLVWGEEGGWGGREEERRREEKVDKREDRGKRWGMEGKERRRGSYLILQVNNNTALNTYKNFSTILVFIFGCSEEQNEK